MPFLSPLSIGRSKKVRFNPVESFSEPPKVKADRKKIWMQASDYEGVKRDTIATGLDVQLSLTHDKQSPHHYCNVHNQVYRTSLIGVEPSAEDSDLFASWIEARPERRGLERLILSDLAVARSKRVLAHRQAILQLQASARFLRIRKHDTVDLLAHTSRQITKPEALYARAFGVADETARARCHARTRVVVINVSVTRKAKAATAPQTELKTSLPFPPSSNINKNNSRRAVIPNAEWTADRST